MAEQVLEWDFLLIILYIIMIMDTTMGDMIHILEIHTTLDIVLSTTITGIPRLFLI